MARGRTLILQEEKLLERNYKQLSKEITDCLIRLLIVDIFHCTPYQPFPLLPTPTMAQGDNQYRANNLWRHSIDTSTPLFHLLWNLTAKTAGLSGSERRKLRTAP